MCKSFLVKFSLVFAARKYRFEGIWQWFPISYDRLQDSLFQIYWKIKLPTHNICLISYKLASVFQIILTQNWDYPKRVTDPLIGNHWYMVKLFLGLYKRVSYTIKRDFIRLHRLLKRFLIFYIHFHWNYLKIPILRI